MDKTETLLRSKAPVVSETYTGFTEYIPVTTNNVQSCRLERNAQLNLHSTISTDWLFLDGNSIKMVRSYYVLHYQ